MSNDKSQSSGLYTTLLNVDLLTISLVLLLVCKPESQTFQGSHCLNQHGVCRSICHHFLKVILFIWLCWVFTAT